MDKCCECGLGCCAHLDGVPLIMKKSLIDKLKQVAIEHQILTGERVEYVNFQWFVEMTPRGKCAAINETKVSIEK